MSSHSAPLAAPAAAPPASARSRTAGLLAAYTAAVFLSAFLLFLVQPLFGKMVLPLLGGSPAVWNTCMLFFQAALLGGYLYAHVSSSRLTVRRQAMVHLAALALAALALPVSLRSAAPEGGAAPIPWLLGVMALTVGAPFLVLSGTGPILQRWFSRSGHAQAADPYHLYAASNLGSALALIAYPLLMEPRMRLATQSATWTAGYAVLALLIAGCAALIWRTADAPAPAPALDSVDTAAPGESDGSADSGGATSAVADAPAARVTLRERMIWTGLAFIPSSLLLGVTTFITTDLSPAPLLWVLPLALYLLSFTFVFARRPLIPHEWMVAVHPSAIAIAVLLLTAGYVKKPAFAVPMHLLALFIIAMAAHGELARRRPHVRHLTEFYLWISVGGVLGGVFNALVAPVAFNEIWEYPIILTLACLARPWPEARIPLRGHLMFAVRAAAFAWGLLYLADNQEMRPWLFLLMAAVLINLLNALLGRAPLWLAACIGVVLLVRASSVVNEDGVLLSERTFFGRYKVVEYQHNGGFHVLRHGSTLHGAQSLEPYRRREPLTYYLMHGPLGKVFAVTADRAGRRRVAVVGLGTGTTAAYARQGEDWTFYEIDPGIERIARDTAYFSYLADSPARTRVVLGDARLSLAQTDRTYDLILLDAFSSDAIPVHLMTREALDTYLARLAPRGLIVFHISNRYLDLEPVVAALAKDRGLVTRAGVGPRDRRPYESTSTWIAVARNAADLGPLTADANWWAPRLRADVEPWTDDYSSLLTVFDW
ncbi:spermidine synthase [Longimicrobium sp.]|uniref:spermidine synthase n=1 Tax=Longimicrobium sp. TaxID=2029185 RepID=UPI003B39FAD5